MESFGVVVRRAMDEHGWSLRATARATHYDPGYLSRVLRGVRRPTPDLARRLDDVLALDGALTALVEMENVGPLPSLPLPTLSPDPDLYDRLTAVVEHPRRVDEHAVAWLEKCLAEHRRAEDTLGSGPVLAVVRAQLDTVAGLTRDVRTPALRDRLVSLAAQYGQFMAWLCNDQQDKGAALAWYDRAHGWAVEAADPSMAATTLSMKAHIAWSMRDGAGCLRLGEAARWHDQRTSRGVAGMATQMQARGHALLGEADAARRLLDEAEAVIRDASQRPEDEPDWMYFYGDTWFLAQRGMVELDLGAGEQAADMIGRALAELPSTYRRDRAWFQACLARAHLLSDDLEAATSTGLATVTDAHAVNPYAVGELKGVASAASTRSTRIARDLVDALR